MDEQQSSAVSYKRTEDSLVSDKPLLSYKNMFYYACKQASVVFLILYLFVQIFVIHWRREGLVIADI